ncbi:class I SAM-dependent methyltransferase [Bordetella sp. 02P26C-1]|uniref:class I SAM-dependent methyltransferase n=1 Tax=Bordetella sp. 02P26C-1 TaxID=2683195 RepID=UPI0013561FC1|nr:SAM-dependent methyltransferase [Bordetella sp. 02P26C-1]MVW79371.1 class I SAM-dependent methyltransferase [Bordetella sp. 02P26C-1]
MQRNTSSSLPVLDTDSANHSARAAAHLRLAIESAGGWLPFDQWMAQALYAPGLGYYAAGAVKLASAAATDARGTPIAEGDFVTAPELTPLFGQSVARQVAQILSATDTHTVLEFGAGTGALAESVLNALDELLPDVQYRIMEISADLRARQQARLAKFGDRVQWFDALPGAFSGCVLANEVLDAMPVSVFRWSEDGDVLERGVALDAQGAFCWQERTAGPELARAVTARMPPLAGYVSEINLQAEAWMRGVSGWLEKGAALLFDYGFPRREYYHPQRAGGTLMCHLHHHAHDNPFYAPGVQDITAHVDFTAMADAAFETGMQVLGYTSQARFLMNAGLAELLAQLDPTDVRSYAQAVAPVQKLLSEAEMGELFKVLAVGRGVETALLGFARGDRLSTL